MITQHARQFLLRDSLHKLRMTAWSSHPVPVARAADLRQWIDSGAYARVLGGDDPHRDTDGDARVSDAAKEAAESYRESFENSTDPLVGLVRRVGGGAADIGEWAGSQAGKARDWAATAADSAARAARRRPGGDDGDSGQR